MSETNIELLEPVKVADKVEDVQLPVNFVSVGEINRDSVNVYIKQDVYKKIEKI